MNAPVPKSRNGFLLLSFICIIISLFEEVCGFSPPIHLVGIRSTAGPQRHFLIDSFLTRPSSSRRKWFLGPVSSSAQDTDHTSQKQQYGKTASAQQNFSVTFPSYAELQQVEVGEFIASPSFLVESPDGRETHEFRVFLYPRGGGHSSSTTIGKKMPFQDNNNNREEGGFGMSYKVVPLFQRGKNDKVGVYLQYLPKTEESSVDLTFTLRLKGRQSSGPRFDVEWSAGMRFVAKSQGKLVDGLANDFGAHLMQSDLLPTFLGEIDYENDIGTSSQWPAANKLEVQIRTKVHPVITDEPQLSSDSDTLTSAPAKNEQNAFSSFFTGGGILPLDDIRAASSDRSALHDTEKVRVGKIVVPILTRLSQRPGMFAKGVYPGVEYRIMRMFDPATDEEVFYSAPGVGYELKPVYPLVKLLERIWPVRVNESEIPKLYTANMYNAVSAIGSLLIAITGLTTAFVVSQLVSLFFIPSKSMEPTLHVGDVLVVEKVSPIFQKGKVGDVVLFSPPSRLSDIVSKSGGRISERDLFVKRIAAESGDVVSVDRAGAVMVNGKPVPGDRNRCDAEPLRLIEKYIQPMENVAIPKDGVFVMGDCSSVSIDSRVWGPLDKKNIVGHPILRIWPLGERFGSVPPLEVSDQIDQDADWR